MGRGISERPGRSSVEAQFQSVIAQENVLGQERLLPGMRCYVVAHVDEVGGLGSDGAGQFHGRLAGLGGGKEVF